MLRTILLSAFASLLLFTTNAQYSEVDQNAFIAETQNSKSGTGDLKLVWWIPVEFWKIVIGNEPSMPKAQVNELISALEPYSIFAVINGKVGSFGAVNYTPLEEIENSLQFKDQTGNVQRPINMANLNSETQMLLNMFKPILQSMMGEMGENLQFFVFEDIDKSGNRKADPAINGTLSLKVLQEEYAWSTPLASLLPPKSCPIDGAEMKGNWLYCPYHGKKLNK